MSLSIQTNLTPTNSPPLTPQEKLSSSPFRETELFLKSMTEKREVTSLRLRAKNMKAEAKKIKTEAKEKEAILNTDSAEISSLRLQAKDMKAESKKIKTEAKEKEATLNKRSIKDGFINDFASDETCDTDSKRSDRDSLTDGEIFFKYDSESETDDFSTTTLHQSDKIFVAKLQSSTSAQMQIIIQLAGNLPTSPLHAARMFIDQEISADEKAQAIVQLEKDRSRLKKLETECEDAKKTEKILEHKIHILSVDISEIYQSIDSSQKRIITQLTNTPKSLIHFGHFVIEAMSGTEIEYHEKLDQKEKCESELQDVKQKQEVLEQHISDLSAAIAISSINLNKF